MLQLPLFTLDLIAGIVRLLQLTILSDGRSGGAGFTFLSNWTEKVRICLESPDRRQKDCHSLSTILIKTISSSISH